MSAELPTLPDLDPKERLEATRRAIAGQLARKRGGAIATEEAVFAPAEPLVDTGVVASARRMGRAWWQSHPLHKALDVTEPMLGDYARRKPYQLLAIAAATGASLTLLKSIRLLSLTGVALTLLKTSDLRSTARQFIGSSRETDVDHAESPTP